MANPLPASLKDVNFYRLQPRSFPQILVAGYVWPANLKNSSEAGVNRSLDSFLSSHSVSPGFGFIERYRLQHGVLKPRSDDLRTSFSC